MGEATLFMRAKAHRIGGHTGKLENVTYEIKKLGLGVLHLTELIRNAFISLAATHFLYCMSHTSDKSEFTCVTGTACRNTSNQV